MLISVVNMIPRSLSWETNQDSEPNLAVNPANPLEIAGSAFTPDPFGGPNAPIFVSTDGGNTWLLNSTVPSDPGTGDITLRFGGATGSLYTGILRLPGFLRLNILRADNFAGPVTMAVLVDRPSVDQPYVQTIATGGRDRVYVGNNDFAAPGQRTATVDLTPDGGVPVPPGPLFTPARVEARGTSGQDGPPVRVAAHPDGTLYAAFYGWRAFDGLVATTDVVVVRDDNGGFGANPFTSLVDSDGLAGVRVVQERAIPWANYSQPTFGQERFVGSNISIAVDPNDSASVYVAWADRVGCDAYTLHVRRSGDRGVTWSSVDLRTIPGATNPALAVNEAGVVGFLYQQLTGGGAGQRWATHLELTRDQFGSRRDLVLADVSAMVPPPQFVPYIGDYVHLMAVGEEFFGIFSANNTPDLANFPQGVSYQRNADFATQTLLDNNNRPVAVSIDPFFFRVAPPPRYEYAAKILCGFQRDPEDLRLARGAYATTINIHNPHEREIRFFKKLALTFPPGEQQPGKVLPLAYDILRPDEALAVDCRDIQRRLFPGGMPAACIEGFVIIQSPASLDVTAVYTTAALDARGQVTAHSAIAVKQIRERRREEQPALPDLVALADEKGSFCRLRDGNLAVTVKNKGTGPAGASTTEVEFAGHARVALPTPPLGPGELADLLFDIPSDCSDRDWTFRIIVDARNQVAERNEANNIFEGRCLG
ncbi:MAG TPA: CARDB domain-containing protein [Herpetosiphonaceae bacterium]|nr:CARDB domain-containing protein [Herpetosiphonaceae bacterium]